MTPLYFDARFSPPCPQGHQLEVASAHEGGPAQVEGRTRRQGSKMSRFWRMSEAGYVVDGSQKPRLGQLGNVAEAREREMLFCKRMEHLTVVGLELPTLKVSGRHDRHR